MSECVCVCEREREKERERERERWGQRVREVERREKDRLKRIALTYLSSMG